MMTRPTVWIAATLAVAGAAYGGPVPIGSADITVSYQTAAGPVSFTDPRDFNGALGSQTPLGAAANISAFNSAGSEIGVFGRRAAPILLADPSLPAVIGPNESLVSHAFFKIDNDQAFFADMTPGSDLTVTINNIQFAEPVTIVEETLMLHTKWRPEQVDQLDDFYIQLDDHRTITDTFRDFDTFLTRVFFDQPQPNYLLNDPDLAWSITGNGTDTLSLSFTFPYESLRNFEETGQVVDPGLPAPHGFLEPFHFHIEYVVVPEPGTLLLAAVGTVVLGRRRRRLRRRGAA